MNRLLLAVSCAALLLGAGAASAATVGGNLDVRANVQQVCTIAAAVPELDFGDYDPSAGAAATGSQSLTVTCNQGYVPPIALGTGLNPAGAQRQMANGANRLAYDLSVTVTAATDAAGVVGATVNGTIPAGQWVPTGVYTDRVTVTVTF